MEGYKRNKTHCDRLQKNQIWSDAFTGEKKSCVVPPPKKKRKVSDLGVLWTNLKIVQVKDLLLVLKYIIYQLFSEFKYIKATLKLKQILQLILEKLGDIKVCASLYF